LNRDWIVSILICVSLCKVLLAPVFETQYRSLRRRGKSISKSGHKTKTSPPTTRIQARLSGIPISSIWNTYFVQFINLILQPLQTRPVDVFLDEKGDISGQFDGPGIWRRFQFKSYSLDRIAKTLELQFQINKQKKGLILDINDIKKFDSFGIRFQHPTDPDCVLFNLFTCDEFAQPRRHDSDRFKRRIAPKTSDHYVVSATRERMADYAEVFL